MKRGEVYDDNLMSTKNLLIFLTLFNVLFLSYLLLQFINHPDNTYYWVVGLMKHEQFLYSYFYEFMQRGLIGTIIQLFDFIPTHKQIYYGSLAISNVFLLLYIKYSKKMMFRVSKHQFLGFILFFILSPATALHLGYDVGRFDQITLLLTVIILLIITAKKYKIIIWCVPFLIAVGLLIHEAFLFINLPIITCVLLNEIKKKNYKLNIFFFSSVVMIIVLTVLFLFGKVNADTVQYIAAKAGYKNGYKGSLSLLSRDTLVSIKMTLNSFHNLDTWRNIFVLVIIISLYVRLYFSTFKKYFKQNIFINLVLLSPFAILIMFFLGVDFHRWFALLIINLFLVYPYLIKEFKIENIYQSFGKMDRKLLKIGYFLFVFGAIGVTTAFPYIIKILDKFF